MRIITAASISALFFAVAPGVVAGVVPWWLSGWTMRAAPPGLAWLRVAGALLIVAGAAVLIHSFVRFVVEGRGTPVPFAPTEHLVVGGLYRYVRNPMYLAVITAIAGQALVLWRFSLLLYGAAVAAVMLAFVRFYEEPVLARRYGAEYDSYRRAVPGWWPRLRPWKGNS